MKNIVLCLVLIYFLSGCSVGTALRVLDMSSGALKHIGKEKSTQYKPENELIIKKTDPEGTTKHELLKRID